MINPVHEESERLAIQAEEAVRLKKPDEARQFYGKAAELEEQALKIAGPGDSRIWGILAVSAASLWFKSGNLNRSESLACGVISQGGLPRFAHKQLNEVNQAVWAQRGLQEAKKQIREEQMMVSLRGGSSIAVGAAPIGLVLETIEGVRKLLYRVAECLAHVQFRKRGQPSASILATCQPIISQPQAGSFRFGLQFMESTELLLFDATPSADKIQEFFLQILSSLTPSLEPDPVPIQQLVPDREYQDAFMKLVRNIAPDGKLVREIEFTNVAPKETHSVRLHAGTRELIRERLTAHRDPREEVILKGVLRGVHLDAGWLLIDREKQTSIRAYFDGTMLDDVIGPMVNREVIVRTYFQKNVYRLLDIELDTGEPMTGREAPAGK